MEIKGDFLGFEFAGVRSEDLGIVRVSGGDRYSEELHSEVKDITVDVPGMNGSYYFGSTYGPKKISIEIAFDSVTEEQFRRIRQVFGRKSQGELIFDERPYKRYIAKIESPIELSYVCFDEPYRPIEEERNGPQVEKRYGTAYLMTSTQHNVSNARGNDVIVAADADTLRRYEETILSSTVVRKKVRPYGVATDTHRVYKGEGKIDMVAYFPFAKSCFKILQGDDIESDWAVSSGIMTDVEYASYVIDQNRNGSINIYNGGDLPTGFRLYCPFSIGEEDQTYENLVLNYFESMGADPVHLVLQNVEKQGDDVGFVIDTNTNLVVGVSNMGYDQDGNVTFTTSSNLYNQYVTSGYFFQLQPNLKTDSAKMIIMGGNNHIQIFYNYLYF